MELQTTIPSVTPPAARDATARRSLTTTQEAFVRSLGQRIAVLSKRKPSVVAIDGYYGSGKTTLARTLHTALTGLQQETLVICTDEFMRYSRADRQFTRERYYDHCGWYDLEQILSVLVALAARPQTTMKLTRLYNHDTGELDGRRQIVAAPVDVIILEGMYAFHPSLSTEIDLGMMLKADHEALLARVISRDTAKRFLTERTVRERYWIINGSPYANYFRSRVNSADFMIDNTFVPDIEVTCRDPRHELGSCC